MHPAPSATLRELPLEAKAQAPPPTPRNASHLYGEFAWPSLDVASLIDKLEDIADADHDDDDFHDAHVA